jgi:hypothetical protein
MLSEDGYAIIFQKKVVMSIRGLAIAITLSMLHSEEYLYSMILNDYIVIISILFIF